MIIFWIFLKICFKNSGCFFLNHEHFLNSNLFYKSWTMFWNRKHFLKNRYIFFQIEEHFYRFTNIFSNMQTFSRNPWIVLEIMNILSVGAPNRRFLQGRPNKNSIDTARFCWPISHGEHVQCVYVRAGVSGGCRGRACVWVTGHSPTTVWA